MNDLASGPIAPLAQRHLAQAGVVLAPFIPRHEVERAKTFPLGLDHLGGEILIGLAQELAITDRRAIMRASAARLELPYTALTDVKLKSGLFGTDLLLFSGAHKVKIPGAKEALPPLAEFFKAVAALPIDKRWHPPRELAGFEDALGIGRVLATFPNLFENVKMLLRVVKGAASRKWIPAEVAIEFVQRAALAQRTVELGRGEQQGWLISPLAMQDLAHVLVTLFGPQRQHWDGTTLTYDCHRGGGPGWFAMPGQAGAVLRIAMRELRSATLFTLYAGAQPLVVASVHAQTYITEAIAAEEVRVLMRRCIFGWQQPAQEIAAWSPQEMTNRAAALAEDVDAPVRQGAYR